VEVKSGQGRQTEITPPVYGAKTASSGGQILIAPSSTGYGSSSLPGSNYQFELLTLPLYLSEQLSRLAVL